MRLFRNPATGGRTLMSVPLTTPVRASATHLSKVRTSPSYTSTTHCGGRSTRYSAPFKQANHFSRSTSLENPKFLHVTGSTNAKFKLLDVVEKKESDEAERKKLALVPVGGPSKHGPTALQIREYFLYAIVDSGLGGSMATALIAYLEVASGKRLEIRALAHGLCLPIGDKREQIATCYTALMALWPMISPLANSKGEDDGRLAKHCYIACNSASVRIEGAIKLMTLFCLDVRDSPEKYRKLPAELLANINALASRPNLEAYFKSHVHEIVTPTATRAANKAWEALSGSKKDYFIRVDSTNGTCGSGAYPGRIEQAIRANLPKDAAVEIVRTDNGNSDIDKCNISHTVIKFECSGIPRRLVIEGRGNPAWVKIIEGGELAEKGAAVVAESQRQSQDALARSTDLVAEDAAAFDRMPDLEILACTHYPALSGELRKAYGEHTEFLDQSTVLAQMVQALVSTSGEDHLLIDDEVRQEGSSASVAITLGSQNMNNANTGIEPTVPSGQQGEKKADMLAKIMAESAGRRNALPIVNIFTQDPADRNFDAAWEKTPFEKVQSFITALNPGVLAEQQLEADFELTQDARARFRSGPTVLPTFSKIKPVFPELMLHEPAEVRRALEELSKLTPVGQTHGMSVIGQTMDNPAHLRALTLQLTSVIQTNKQLPAGVAKEAVGILTGYTVINDQTGARIAGENDGPPGAVVMAQVLLEEGTPVTLVTDLSALPVLLCTLEGAGLAKRNFPLGEDVLGKTLADYTITEPLLSIEVPDVDNTHEPPRDAKGRFIVNRDEKLAREQQAVRDSIDRLRYRNITTMISIRRPVETRRGDLFSTAAKDISSYNISTAGYMRKETAVEAGKPIWAPYRGAIGNSGNETGADLISEWVAHAQDPAGDRFVSRGIHIAANPESLSDALVLGSTSNDGGVSVAMALKTALAVETDEKGATTIDPNLAEDLLAIENLQHDVLEHLYENNASIDGVAKQNLLSVDGRPMGSVEDSLNKLRAEHYDFDKVVLGVDTPAKEQPSDVDISMYPTHRDKHMRMRHAILSSLAFSYDPESGYSPN